MMQLISRLAVLADPFCHQNNMLLLSKFFEKATSKCRLRYGLMDILHFAPPNEVRMKIENEHAKVGNAELSYVRT